MFKTLKQLLKPKPKLQKLEIIEHYTTRPQDPAFLDDWEAQMDMQRRIEQVRQQAYSDWINKKEAQHFKKLVEEFMAGRVPTIPLVETYRFHDMLKAEHPDKFQAQWGSDGKGFRGYSWQGDRLSYWVDHGEGYITLNTYIPNQVTLTIEERPYGEF